MPVQVATVTRQDSLYRRLVSFQVEGERVTSAAYKDKKGKPDPEPSVDLARLTTPEKSREYGGKPGLGVGELPAKVPLDLGLRVVHQPDLATGNMAHCVIKGNNKATYRQLAENTRVIIPPRSRDHPPS